MEGSNYKNLLSHTDSVWLRLLLIICFVTILNDIASQIQMKVDFDAV